MINFNNVSKIFKVPVPREGFIGKTKDLFFPQYTKKIAVNNVSFNIKPGEIVGFIGPNGAGKSTTIKMLCGILNPSLGEVRINGYNPLEDKKEIVREIGAIFGHRTQLWWDLPLIDSLKLNQKLYGISDEDFNTRIADLYKRFDVSEYIHTPVRKLSLGQRVRADLIASLIHSPKIVFLDEPTIGLDIFSKEAVRELILSINQEFGVTIILTTHDFSDIEKTCDRLMIIEKGNLIYDGGMEYLKRKYTKKRILCIELEEQPKNIQLNIPFTEVQNIEKNKIYLLYDNEKTNASFIITHIANKYSIKDVVVEESKIEDIVKQIYSESSDKQEFNTSKQDNLENAFLMN